jgi:hypothetical protein
MSVPSPVNESLLSQRLGALGSARSWATNVLPELERFIRTAEDYDLFRINPIQYGGAVELSEADAIELFVNAAKVGLFEMDWLLICAYCPQVAGSFRELDQVHPRLKCAFCNAINDVALDDYIQVTFTVSNGVRDIIFRTNLPCCCRRRSAHHSLRRNDRRTPPADDHAGPIQQ